MRRRDFLRSLGTFSGGVFGCSGAEDPMAALRRRRPQPGAGDPSNDQHLPVDAVGVTYYHARELSDREQFRVQRVFRSPMLRERYGDPLFRFPAREVPASKVTPEARRTGQDTLRRPAQYVIGTHEEHRTAERLIAGRSSIQTTGDVPQHVVDELGDEIPLHHYEGEADDVDKSEDELSARGVVLNVHWEGMDPETVKAFMQTGTYGRNWEPSLAIKIFGGHDRYTYGTDDDPIDVAEDIMDCSPGTCPSTQYHIRTYDLERDEPNTIGQAHRDPCHHNFPYSFGQDQVDRGTDAVDRGKELLDGPLDGDEAEEELESEISCVEEEEHEGLIEQYAASFRLEETVDFVKDWWTGPPPEDLPSEDDTGFQIPGLGRNVPLSDRVRCRNYTQGEDPRGEFDYGLIDVQSDVDDARHGYPPHDPPEDSRLDHYYGKILYIHPIDDVPEPPDD